jgi:hypothetical protein
MIQRLGRLAAAILVWGSFVSAPVSAEIQIHVAPDGADSASGAKQAADGSGDTGPVRSLGRAQQVARQLLAAMRNGQRPAESVRIVLAPGVHRLSATLRIGREDSGFPDAPVVYAASAPGKVFVSGGVPLAVKRADDREVVFAAPEGMAAAIRGGGQLYVRGRLATLARMPNRGEYWFVQRAVALPNEGEHAGKRAFVPDPASLDLMAKIPPAERSRAILNVMHSWSAGMHRLAGVAESDRIEVTPRALWPFLSFGRSQRYFVENVSTAFDSPGEWLWQGNEIRYLLERGETSEGIEATLPVLERLVEVRGSGAPGGAVEHLRFEGIVFQHARSLVPEDGFFDLQAAVKVGAAIEVSFARQIEFSGCEISSVGGHGLWLREGVRLSSVVANVFTVLGAGGTKVGLEAQQPEDGSATGANRILGNRISETGKRYVGAVGIWVGQSFDNELGHNTIWNTTYTGISVGWKWGYGGARSGRNRIHGNLLYNIGQGYLDDLGAIYTLGESPGTEISRNLIREVRAYRGYGPGGWGIYLDEGSSGIAVRNNVVIGTDSGAVHLHFGRDNVIVDNLFAGGEPGELMVRRSDPGRTRLRFENNVLVASTQSILNGYVTSADVSLAGNLLLTQGDKPPVSESSCRAGCTPANGAVRVESAPRSVSIVGLDAARRRDLDSIVGSAGVLPSGRNPPDTFSDVNRMGWALAPVSNAPRERRLMAAAKPIVISPAELPGGVRPPEFTYQPKGDATGIRVVRDASAPGGACLMMEDGPQFANKYDPHMHMKLDFSDGGMAVSFPVRIDAGADFIHEWRDDAIPYRTGPALRISSAGLEVGGKVLLQVEPGDWLRISIRARMGERSKVWQLSVQDARQRTHTFADLGFKSADWGQLKWLGFISNAAQRSLICIGQLSIEPSP